MNIGCGGVATAYQRSLLVDKTDVFLPHASQRATRQTLVMLCILVCFSQLVGISMSAFDTDQLEVSPTAKRCPNGKGT